MATLETEVAADFPGFEATFTYRGTTALYLALKALGSPGSRNEIIVPATVCPDVPLAVLLAGFVPRFCDVDLATFCMTPHTVAAVLNSHTRAVIVVHLFGKAVAMQEILALARSRGAAVIEDVAQAIGGRLRGRRLGSFGDMAILSFDDKKILSGKGGLLLTSSADQITAARQAHAQLDLPMDPARASSANAAFAVSTRRLYVRMRADGLRQFDRSLATVAGTPEIRRMYLARSAPGPSAEPVQSYRDLDRQRQGRRRAYQKYAALLKPGVQYIRYEAEELCWRLPILLESHAQQEALIAQIHELGALVSDHYFPVSYLFGDGACPNAREIGLRAINLWVDDKLDEKLLPAVCDIVNRTLGY